MVRIKVEVPFYLIATETHLVPGDVIEVSEEQLEKIQAVDAKLVTVIGEVEKPKKTKAR